MLFSQRFWGGGGDTNQVHMRGTQAANPVSLVFLALKQEGLGRGWKRGRRKRKLNIFLLLFLKRNLNMFVFWRNKAKVTKENEMKYIYMRDRVS